MKINLNQIRYFNILVECLMSIKGNFKENQNLPKCTEMSLICDGSSDIFVNS